MLLVSQYPYLDLSLILENSKMTRCKWEQLDLEPIVGVGWTSTLRCVSDLWNVSYRSVLQFNHKHTLQLQFPQIKKQTARSTERDGETQAPVLNAGVGEATPERRSSSG